ncbi:MAG: ribulose-phosphate 3-epimerase [Chloroflexi bacterium]|nr:ribulose-phosphate 3-epimerase [Chloroflexota bacterium]
MPPVKVAPSVLAADFTHLGDEVRAVSEADQIHIDVMDGRFVPNISMGPMIVSAIKRVTDLPLDVHLMIVEPEDHIDAFAGAGAEMITVHQEASPDLHHTLKAIRDLGVKAGVAIKPETSPLVLADMLHMLDIILVMTVDPGFGGQPFMKETLSKIQRVRQMVSASNREIDVSVDGGIDAETAPWALEAGANVFVAGSSIFGAEGGPTQGLQVLKSALEK